jgi:MoaA/NifB/PqqE/SkfB family radical SAM enzyme
MISSGPVYEQKILDLNRILLWLNNFDKPITISLGGSGDALASLIIRNFIKTYDYKPNHEFCIATNGLLLKKVLDKSKMKNAISQYSVSVDAGTAKTYENVRRPGRWTVLLENLSWLHEHKEKAVVNLNFVLQRDNYKDLPAFVELCEKFNFNGKIQPLNDWGTWNSKLVVNPDAYTLINGTYLDHDVANPNHPDYDHFIQILNDVRKNDHKFLHIAPYFNQHQ